MKALLKGAKPVRTLSNIHNQPYGAGVFCLPLQEAKVLYSGTAGCFIVHCVFHVSGIPEERVLSLPADLNLDSCLIYESNHQKDYSPWYHMEAAEDAHS